jgi:NosR/NirI family nitrous oxide reductase transcriptional regulator
MCSGCYFPIAARQLTDAGFELGQAGSKLEMADHLGAAVGGFVTSLALVPILGTRPTLFLIVVIILTNAPPAILKFYRQIKVCFPAAGGMAFRRRVGYTLTAVGVTIVLGSNLLAWAGARLSLSLPVQVAKALVGQQQLKQNSAILAESGRKINYFKVYNVAEESVGYVFSSLDLAPEVRGFGGKMNIAIFIDQNGTLVDFHILHSNETPSYLDLLNNWRGRLKGHNIFTTQPFAGVNAVTGATVSSTAIISALEQSGHNFLMHVLGRSVATETRLADDETLYLLDISGMYLVAALVLALIVSYYGGFWSRLAVLFINLLVGGIILNFQYSSEQIVTFLSFQVPTFKLAGPFLLIVGIPVVVLLFGNFYCGYICPFGALQELLSYIVPKRFKRPVPRDQMQWGRFVKYVVLFVLLTAFFLVRNRTTLAADPLISVFGLRISPSGFRLAGVDLTVVTLVVVVAALLFSLFYTRWWCRYLCPAGAFLSLLNGIALFKKYLPAKKFSKCEFGLTARDNLDCIQCDRCRYEKKALTQRPTLERISPTYAVVAPRLFIISVLVAGILISGISIRRFLRVVPTGSDYLAKFVSSGGQPRDVDVQHIRKLIEQNRLSDHEADYYKRVE